MKVFLEEAAFFGVLVSLASYGLGVLLKKKFKLGIFNPLLIAIAATIAFLLVFDLDYQKYTSAANTVSFFLTPATVCLAVPLYKQFRLLRENYKAIIAGITAGVVSSLLTVFVMCLVLRLDHTAYVTLLPKSITTAIGMVLSEELGGYPSLSAAIIIVTGVFGNMTAVAICKLARITHPIAKGIGIGSASHAVGTAKALELGETEGAMSSLSIVISGLLTVFGAGIFSNFI